MCGSNDVVKQGGYYVCQNCGTKYTVEEARKIMIEGVVNVQGTVRIDHTDEVKNLYEIARRAKDTDNYENALKYYEMIVLKDPSSWEANFYIVYFKAKSFTFSDIKSAASSISKCLYSIIELIRDNVSDENQKQVFEELHEKTLAIAKEFINAAKSYYQGMEEEKRKSINGEYYERVLAIKQLLYDFGDDLELVFGEKFAGLSVEAWKEGNLLLSGFEEWEIFDTRTEDCKNTIMQYANKIKKYEPNYEAPMISSGCCFYIIGAIVVIVFVWWIFF